MWDFLYVKHTASRKCPDFIVNFISFTFVTNNKIITQNVTKEYTAHRIIDITEIDTLYIKISTGSFEIQCTYKQLSIIIKIRRFLAWPKKGVHVARLIDNYKDRFSAENKLQI